MWTHIPIADLKFDTFAERDATSHESGEARVKSDT